MKKFYTLLSLVSLISLGAAAQTKTISLTETTQAPEKANYQAAARFSPNKLRKIIYSTAVDPHWLKLTNRFWYQYETPSGKFWYMVDPVLKSKNLLFDNEKMASAITLIVRDPFDAQHLPIENLKFAKDEKSINFEVKSTIEELKKDRKDKKAADSMQKKIFFFNYELASQKLTEVKNYEKPKAKPSWGSVAPDSSAVIFSKNYNLYWMDKANYLKAVKNDEDSTIVEHQLTKDGVKFYSYGSDGDGEDNEINIKNNKKRRGAYVLWSPDSKYFVLDRTDSRKVKDLWVINSTGAGRPTLETFKYQMPGEKESPIDEFVLFNFAAKTQKTINTTAFKDQTISTWGKESLVKDRDNEFRPSIWLGDNEKFYFSRTSRDLKRVDICTINIQTGVVTQIIDERFNTYVEVQRPGLIDGGKEIIHWSERDGWGHFYLFDGNGKLKNQITTGAYHCEGIVNIDQKNRVLYFTANGKEKGEDPYYLHLYRINFDGTGMKLLNPGDFDHAAGMNDEG
ncbi:MAG: DPP IV N-terminal domain-containing protein, partial [Sphingobacteriaceae bacterium]|nr:DPP IV N-terminal domain-containing protein [Sphingobacteriaceae bacterium]